MKVVPFAKDIDENFLAVRLADDGSNEVIQVDPEGDGTFSVSESTGKNFAQYLENMRSKLLTGKLVYEDGLGLISVA